MKKSNNISKYLFFLVLILIIMVSATAINISHAIPNEFTFDLSPFKESIKNSSNDCWKKPAQNRKHAMDNKLDELQELIDTGNFEDAYDKLLHDIKPKLTGLKTDENEEPWGNRIFNKPWVICSDLREEFRVECNLILSQINPLVVYDDDKSPPEISIIYESMQNVDDPGLWHVDIKDLESGLDIIIISVNGIEEVYDLKGEWLISFDILVPAIIGINTIVVTATNDIAYDGVQETGVKEHSVCFDTTAPTIGLDFEGETYSDNPGMWLITVEDLESGLDIIYVSVDGVEQVYDLNGEKTFFLTVQSPGTLGLHILQIIAINNDKDYIGDQESSTRSASVYIETRPPPEPLPPIIL